jgi:hypothetical protein
MMDAWADYLDGLRDGANVVGTLCRTLLLEMVHHSPRHLGVYSWRRYARCDCVH